MSRVNPDTPPTLLRWTDYLTGRTCALRVCPADAGAPLSLLLSKYLTAPTPESLARNRLLMPGSVSDFAAIQDLVHVIATDGSLAGLVPGAALRSGVRRLSVHQPPPATPAMVMDSTVSLIDVSIDRSETGYSRNWDGFDERRWRRSERAFTRFVERATLNGAGDGERVDADPFADRDSRIEFLCRLAKTIWGSPFENYSRFIGRALRYKTGDEAVASIIEGRGAICSEKVQALKFLADRFGFESHYLFAGPDAPPPLPVERLRHTLDTFDFRGAAPAMRYWQHMALEFVVDGERILVDATNGNIPFLFLRGPELDCALDPERPNPIRVKMGTYSEDFYYHRVPDDLARDLCYAMENFIPEIDIVQVFDNELGMAITPDFLVSPMPYASEADFRDLAALYERLVAPAALPFDADRLWTLDGPVGSEFREREPEAARLILDSRERILERYRLFEGDGHEMGLAVVRLRRS